MDPLRTRTAILVYNFAATKSSFPQQGDPLAVVLFKNLLQPLLLAIMAILAEEVRSAPEEARPGAAANPAI